MLGSVHIVFAIAALIIGAVVLCRPKGDRGHRTLGYVYAISLLSVNISALSVYKDSAGAGPFHVLAAISLATLLGGFVPAFLRRPVSEWLRLHAYLMSWSYVGLVAAGISQIVTMTSGRIPTQLTVGLPSTLVVVIGGVLIHTRTPKILTELTSRRRRPD